ncbi:MAG: NAD(P)H-hydrate dehydratase [Peptococcaceae bacterium]|nr:NAD(P)H-hydrate dehydratase [Peptococcaceae bacterium]
MKVVDAEGMRDIEERAMGDFNIPGVVLMENAGLMVSQEALTILSSLQGKTITIFVGKGNNGGDGFVAARHLFNMGADVKVLMVEKQDDSKGDAAINQEIWRKMGQKIYTVTQNEGLNAARLFLVKTDLVIDAIFGTGFKGTAKDYIGQIIESINASGKPVVSVDIPSGVEADSGIVNGPCVRANITVTFGLPKVGLLLEPGASYTGVLKVVDISLPGSLLADNHIKCNMIEQKMVKSWFPFRPDYSHKGDFGRVLIVAGSKGMAGAACLAAEAAIRSGAGLVSLTVPESIYASVSAKLTEVMVIPVPETTEGTLAKTAVPLIKKLAERADVFAVGPGLSNNPETMGAVRNLIDLIHLPLVLDADGINAFVEHKELLHNFKQPLIVTPHPGEMARLVGCSIDNIQSNRLSEARDWSERLGAVLVLKGARTIIASPDGTAYININGNPGMATAGCGDVLTGIIAGLMAQGMDGITSAAAGVYLHGAAGDESAKRYGMMGLIAGDIIDALPKVTQVIEVL